jgi:hypothetical protein
VVSIGLTKKNWLKFWSLNSKCVFQYYIWSLKKFKGMVILSIKVTFVPTPISNITNGISFGLIGSSKAST